MMPASTVHAAVLPAVRGRYTENAPLGEVGWFRAGGRAEVLFKPEDAEDLADFLRQCPEEIPVTVLGVLSNTIVRDGGLKGVVVRLGREFAAIETQGDVVAAGAAALDGNVAMAAANAGVGGLEFLSGIPGTIGGALRMNAGCYGAETKDVLVSARAIDRQGRIHDMTPEQMGMTYRHSAVPEDYIFIKAIFRGTPGDAESIKSHIADIKAKRASTQPIREKTGGSTFANPSPQELEGAGLPQGTKAWQLIDRVGGRGLRVGGAMMSELHANFMINTGTATASDLESLGEELIRRVREQAGVTLRWEIRRIGAAA
ncbi:MAG: UDP-N-acetylmuramate dehydrogenase [Micavibrio aeruginosavorus]|nr:UDP-N-acetylmuramate dehydrogenase [Micavibrio aeruginosavorus]